MLYATVHMDEATPHMHVGIVPITEDGRLSAKDFFNGKLKMKAIQDDFHRHMVKSGFDLERENQAKRSMKMFTSTKSISGKRSLSG